MERDIFTVIEGSKALQLLKEGNRRFMDGKLTHKPDYSVERAGLLEKGQRPMAVIFSCSDSRVPPELVFDVGIGEIFVVRTAGNVSDSIAIGSVEFAVSQFKAGLVVVMGHGRCGAVAGAIAGADFGPNIGAIINEILPSLEKVRNAGVEDLQCSCENECIMNTVSKLNGSPILSQFVRENKLLIVGAKYDLATGEADFNFLEKKV